ncbi:MAG: glycosyltransferase family 4 protein, partial [Anaerobutyricum sp.]
MNKKVGFLIMNFESGGGTERVTSVIANELVKKNFDVRIISCQHGNACKFEIDKNIKLYSLNGEKCENSALRKIYVEKQLIKYVKEEQ